MPDVTLKQLFQRCPPAGHISASEEILAVDSRKQEATSTWSPSFRTIEAVQSCICSLHDALCVAAMIFMHGHIPVASYTEASTCNLPTTSPAFRSRLCSRRCLPLAVESIGSLGSSSQHCASVPSIAQSTLRHSGSGAFAAAAGHARLGRSAVSQLSRETVFPGSSARRRSKIMATGGGGGGGGNAMHTPIEELAQDAVVWASQHGLVCAVYITTCCWR